MPSKLWAQPLGGRVVGMAGQPLPLVSLSLLRDSSFVAGGVSDNDGRFQLNAQLVAGTVYTLRLSLIGYESLIRSFTFPDITALDSLQMHTIRQTLHEVVVTSKKPLVTRQADRYTVNVEDSYLASSRTALEVLQHSPGLWVSPTGDIRITGGQTVTVMINDVVQRMPAADLANFLRSLRSEDISRIEVIPNPPAEFEASSSGGIIHIVLKKARKNGLTGTANAGYRIQGSKGYSWAGTSIDYKLNRIYITAGINGSADRSMYTGHTDVIYPDKTGLYNFTRRDNDNRRYFFRAGVVYDVHPRHSVFLQAITTGSKLVQYFSSDLLYRLAAGNVTGAALSAWRRKPQQGSYTLNYNWKTDSLGSGLRVILDHTYSLKTELNELASDYSDNARDRSYRTLTPSDTYINSAQVDYIQQLSKKSSLRAGVKFVHTDRDNEVLAEQLQSSGWKKDTAASDRFRYTEKLLMFYATYEITIGKTSVKTGLRGERTMANGYSVTLNESIRRRYFGWFPSLFISRTLNEKKGSAININYARRVRRPGYNDLNPYRLQVHDFTVLTGNPNLLPQFTHSFRTTWVASRWFSAGAYLQTVKNYIAQTASAVDSNIIEYRSKNFPNSTDYGVFTEGNFTVGRIWSSRNSLSVYRLSNDIDGKRYRRHSFAFQTIQVISLKKVMEIDLVTQYTSASLQANQKTAWLFYTDIGMTRKLLGDRGRLRFAVTDVFNTFREKDLTEFNQTRIDFYQKRPTRTFALSFSYAFNAGKKFTRKRLDNNDSEEKSRL
ncbi:MAG: outer membrane beta-barrel protein [Sphingobacteriales bacterium]|nr:outer membrane beta-barrel protein [Sphingobacteriales bacterium]